MLETVDLQCVRGERTLFSGLDFRLREGELLRIAGANGSGKTSLLRILCGLLAPAHGSVRWHGEDIRRLREEFWGRLVYIGHANAIKDDLTATENLAIACALGGYKAAAAALRAALDQLGIGGSAHRPARVLSQGQRRRVALARLALSGQSPLWILDEPFTALDASAVEIVQALIASHVARGAAVVYTTHVELEIAAAVSLRVDLGPAAGEQ
jgi:heme exporter protein A